MHRSGLISALARRRAAIFTISPIVLCGAERCPTAADTVVRSGAPPRYYRGTPPVAKSNWMTARRHAVCARLRSASPSLFLFFFSFLSFFLSTPDFPIVDQRRINQLVAKQVLARDACLLQILEPRPFSRAAVLSLAVCPRSRELDQPGIMSRFEFSFFIRSPRNFQIAFRFSWDHEWCLLADSKCICKNEFLRNRWNRSRRKNESIIGEFHFSRLPRGRENQTSW